MCLQLFESDKAEATAFFSHIFHPELCIMSANNAVFNSHNCNNNVQCSITVVTFNRHSTVCAVMGVIPRFCIIKRTEPSGCALCSMLS